MKVSIALLTILVRLGMTSLVLGENVERDDGCSLQFCLGFPCCEGRCFDAPPLAQGLGGAEGFPGPCPPFDQLFDCQPGLGCVSSYSNK